MGNRYFPKAVNLGSGLIYHAKLKEGSGLTAFDQISKTNGTLTNMEGSEWTTLVSGGLTFDGVDERVESGVFGLLDGLRQFSVSFFFSLDATGFSQSLVSIQLDNSSDRVMHIEIRGGASDIRFESFPDNANQRAIGGSVTSGQIYHFAGTYDGDVENITGYLDTVVTQDRDFTVSGTNILSGPSSQVQIGVTRGGAGFLQGSVDDFRIYNRVLTIEEIQALNVWRVAT